MDPAAAEAAGYSLFERGLYQESLPYYRRARDQFGTEWMAHANYSSGLHNAAQQSRRHLGRVESAVRSSFERIALMGVSLEEEDLAEFHTRTAHDRALAIYYRGQTLQTWGFPLDALAEYRRALEVAPGDSAIRRVTSSLNGLLARGGIE
jgi:tetratricopeptide (TPR) repeat protein